MKFGIAVAAVLLMLGASPALADDDCKLPRVASLDLTMLHNRITVPATINGHEVRMALDTGGVFSAIAPEAAATLGLHMESLSGNAVMLFGGFRLNQAARADSFQLGQLQSDHTGFSVFPPHVLADGISGVLGADMLSGFDVEIDFANAKVNLFRRNDCGARVIYWTAGPWGEADLVPNRSRHLVTDVMLDGQKIRAMLDTGAPSSVMELEYAQSLFGLKDSDLASVGPNAFSYPFKSLSFDALSVSNPVIFLLPRKEIGFADPRRQRLLIGMDVLGKLHIYIAYSQHKIYFTAAGAR